MPGISKGEVWLVDFGMVAKLSPSKSTQRSDCQQDGGPQRGYSR
jgi:hypothetical protein